MNEHIFRQVIWDISTKNLLKDIPSEEISSGRVKLLSDEAIDIGFISSHY